MQFVENLTADKRVGVRDEGRTVSCESLESALNSIRQLDGRVRTQVILEGKDRALLIGGGNDGRYNVVMAVNVDEEFYNLVNPSGSLDRQLKVVTGGQAGLFAERQCVDLATALRAAEVFFYSGEPASDLAWERP
jgi:hypothetical protein